MNKVSNLLHIAAVCSVVAFFTACASDSGETGITPPSSQTVTLTAYQPSDDDATTSRVGFGSDGKGYWHMEDKISVAEMQKTGDTEFKTATFAKFGLTSGQGTSKGTFSGTITSGLVPYAFALYPYSEHHKFTKDKTFFYLLPKYSGYHPATDYSQTYTGDNSDVSFDMPMYGIRGGNDTGGYLQFYYLGGVICIKIASMPSAKGTLTVTETNNKKLCGSFTVDKSTSTKPSISNTESSETTFNVVEFKYEGATKDKPGVFYLPVAVGEFNLSVKIVTEETHQNASYTRTLESNSFTVNMERGHLKKVNIKNLSTTAVNNHEVVDLGLTSGTLWAKTNVGASNITDDGNFYAWGDTTTSNTYSWNTYSTYCTTDAKSAWSGWKDTNPYDNSGSSSKYTKLLANADAATTAWGYGWTMPTKDQFEELVKECNISIETGNANDGIYFTNKNDSKKIIFLPAAGWYEESQHMNDNELHYWTKDLYPSDTDSKTAYIFEGKATNTESDRNLQTNYLERYKGCTIRPVVTKFE